MRAGPDCRDGAIRRRRDAAQERGNAWQGLHAKFEGDGIAFYASDNDDAEPMRGSAHHLATDSRRSTDQLFSALSSGGLVTTALDMQPWGDYYGKLTDRFGVQWMLNCHEPGRS